MRDLLELHVVHVALVEAGPLGITPEIDVVLSERGADEPDIAEIRPGAAVGAPGHTVADTRLGDARLTLHERDLADQGGHRPLGLGDRETTSGVRGARHGMPDRAR